jgi:hypothetical protein
VVCVPSYWERCDSHTGGDGGSAFGAFCVCARRGEKEGGALERSSTRPAFDCVRWLLTFAQDDSSNGIDEEAKNSSERRIDDMDSPLQHSAENRRDSVWFASWGVDGPNHCSRLCTAGGHCCSICRSWQGCLGRLFCCRLPIVRLLSGNPSRPRRLLESVPFSTARAKG